MVTVKSFSERTGKDGKKFNALELMGEIELVQSQSTGRFYATARRCFISSTFDVQTAKLFIGKLLPGNIVRDESDSYEFEIPDTGERIILQHTWVYKPEQHSHVKVEKVAIPEADLYDQMLAQM